MCVANDVMGTDVSLAHCFYEHLSVLTLLSSSICAPNDKQITVHESAVQCISGLSWSMRERQGLYERDTAQKQRSYLFGYLSRLYLAVVGNESQTNRAVGSTTA